MEPSRAPSYTEAPISPSVSNQRLSFLSLPPEIRIQIYDLLLVNYSQDSVDITPSPVSLDSICPISQKPKLHPALLQTCKQICNEAIPILYGTNRFHLINADDISTISANLEHIRTLMIWVRWWSEPLPWVKTLHMLSEKADRLSFLYLTWEREDLCKNGRITAGGRGLGSNLNFVRALATVRPLERMEIGGFYALHWPAYLSEAMGDLVQVDTVSPGQSSWFCQLASNEQHREWYLKELEEYQKGTEVLNPWALPDSAVI
ncbi:hypothetical protein BDV18DRAFT_156684 [Aspergillus unguis]